MSLDWTRKKERLVAPCICSLRRISSGSLGRNLAHEVISFKRTPMEVDFDRRSTISMLEVSRSMSRVGGGGGPVRDAYMVFRSLWSGSISDTLQQHKKLELLLSARNNMRYGRPTTWRTESCTHLLQPFFVSIESLQLVTEDCTEKPRGRAVQTVFEEEEVVVTEEDC